MLFVFDKSKILFNETQSRINRIAKAKILALAMVETDDQPSDYYASLNGKVITHFLIDADEVIKYNYSTTNVFDPSTKWTSKAEKIIEKVEFKSPISTLQSQTFNSTVQITQDFIPVGAPNRPGKKRTVNGITIHSTGNENSTPRNERDYLENPSREAPDVAWHLVVGDSICIQAVPFDEVCYHAQGGNEGTIGIEMVHSGDRQAVISRTAKLTADLMKKFNLNINQVYRHSDWYKGKICPSILSYNNWEGWYDFLDQVNAYYNNSNDLTTDIDNDESEENASRIEKESTDISFKEEDKNNAGDHIILFTVLVNQKDYEPIEKNLIKTLGDYLVLHKLDTSSIWRLNDLIQSDYGAPKFYNKIEDWNTFLETVKKYTVESESGFDNIEITPTGVPHYDDEGNIIYFPFEQDTRDITNTTYFMTDSTEAVDEDYDSATMNGQVVYNSKFEDGTGLKLANNSLAMNLYEPIYPELTTPPRSTTSLYNNGIMGIEDILKVVREDLVNMVTVSEEDKNEKDQTAATESSQNDVSKTEKKVVSTTPEGTNSDAGNIIKQAVEFTLETVSKIVDHMSNNTVIGKIGQTLNAGGSEETIEKEEETNKKIAYDGTTKPVIGKIPNFFDPYPTDEKIIQLEKHFPIVTMEYEDASNIPSNQLLYMINRFGNTEQRLVRLENILSTYMRYLQRMAARVEINCVYYGGQCMHDKYACIRCLADDLVNDAAIVTMDQCLNCSRYEPIIGQTYDIVDENLKSGKAQIYDDIQASYITKEEFVKNNQIQEHTDVPNVPEQDLTALLKRMEEDKDYGEILKNANNFVMDWTGTHFHEQSPHVINYKYNPDEINKNRAERLSDVYEDGWRNQSIVKVEKPDYGINSIAKGSLGGGNFRESNLYALYHTLDQYEVAPDDSRIKILGYAKQLIEYAQAEKVLYHYGAKISEQYMSSTPDQLISLMERGTDVQSFVTSKPGNTDKAIYFDCSGFTSYVYRIAGVSDHSFTGRDFPGDSDFTVVLTSSDQPNLKEAVKRAIPGDLICYTGHIAIYAGLDEIYHASTDSAPKNKQVLVSKIKDGADFTKIVRHKTMSVPTLKTENYISVNMTLDDFVELEKGKNTGIDTNHDDKIDVVQDGAYIYSNTLLKNYINPEMRMNSSLILQFASIKDTLPSGIITAKTIDEYLESSGITKKVKGIKVDSNYDPVRDENGNLVWEEKYLFPRGEIWIAAAKKSGLSPLFLMAHCMGETGQCNSSKWTNYSGVYMSTDGRNYLFNAYGIWCKDGDPNRIQARKYTEQYQWFSIEKAVVEGATWVYNQYLGEEAVSKYGRQDTAYFMKWHFGNLISGQKGTPVTHQYATDATWADQRGKMMYDCLKYSPVGREVAISQFTLHIPAFKGSMLNANQDTLNSANNTVDLNSIPGNKKLLGNFKLSHYCACEKCCGTSTGITASGKPVQENVTIAVDPTVIPLGSWVYIEGYGKRQAQDTGGAIKGNRIDVYIASHEEALQKGTCYKNVYLLTDEQ